MNTNTAIDENVLIQAGDAVLEGNLKVPENAKGIVLFAHGSGSSRHSPRNRYVAQVIREHGLGTLLFDLLTADEERVDQATRHLRFDIALLASRLKAAARWIQNRNLTRHLKIGFFGSSTGGGAALVAAAQMGPEVGAIVSRGGRPDLAGDALARVASPSLLIVGELDEQVIALNKYAMQQMNCEKQLIIVPGATHLFEEPGTLEAVAKHAAEWFREHLAGKADAAGNRN
ncbi:MAG: dienelactone hydrolase family protein [Acidobacteriota bacterium]|nr:MAG: dienelactone hydrolase family protein [Acidobacteriota bacterium]